METGIQSKINGVDLSELEDQTTVYDKPVPQMVPGRTVHIDADFLAYQVSAEGKEEKTLEEMQHNCSEVIEKLRLLAGAEFVKLHLTPKGSNKGFRFDIAMIKEYQGNRKDKPKPRMLHVMRDWMHKTYGAELYEDCEADDGMAMEQYKAIAAGKHNLSIIATKDKDLCMVPGLALHWDTYEISDTKDNHFGKLWIDERKAQKKLRGRGHIFFWAQMLMGDTADNISGLPLVTDEQYLNPKNPKPKPCGPVMAHKILENAKSNKEAFEIVRALFKDYGEKIGFTNWRNKEPITFGQALASEAALCWMRRSNTADDCLKWMQENCI